ncbi:hypothetical protein [Campylobacter sputorum]|uniref:hypothetical protein n=1 Tax=Campylobacter sputorum TaxID=206 RepID=UPI001E64E685|nr:hypothetical protein [Campylobacter sputorum]
MEFFYTTSYKMHIGFICVILVAVFVHFLLINYKVGDVRYAIRLRNFFPFYYTMLTLIALSGFNMASVLKFDISYNSYIMILSVFLLIGLGIYEFKMLKKTIKTKSFIEFRKKANIKVCLDLLIILFASVI